MFACGVGAMHGLREFGMRAVCLDNWHIDLSSGDMIIWPTRKFPNDYHGKDGVHSIHARPNSDDSDDNGALITSFCQCFNDNTRVDEFVAVLIIGFMDMRTGIHTNKIPEDLKDPESRCNELAGRIAVEGGCATRPMSTYVVRKLILFQYLSYFDGLMMCVHHYRH